jgi:hypothetical protein
MDGGSLTPMEIRPPDAPLDAFFTPVRRRHPDVDIVVLPALEPAQVAGPVDRAHADATLDRVRETAARVSGAVLSHTTVPAAAWAFGPDEGTVVASVRADTTTPNGFSVLVELRGTLERDGWHVRRPPGEVERLVGVRGDVRVQASYAETTGALLLEVRSGPIHVGRSRARELVRR